MNVSSASGDILERHLARTWLRGLVGPRYTVDGIPLSIVFRGRCPGGAGPDIRGALVAFGNGTLREGDVEFHRRTSDWFTHGHGRDNHYRSVILHVVLEHDLDSPLGADGQSVPTLVIAPTEIATLQTDSAVANPAECHRSARERGVDALGSLLDGLGDRRLTQRAARFEADLTRLTPEGLAYEALFDALGFSRNRVAFVRLASAVPLDLLLALLGRRPNADAILLAEAILFGAAGLLPSQRVAATIDWDADATVEELEAIWALYRGDWEGLRLGESDWVFGGVRPANYPTRRIATAVRLILRYRDIGLDVGLLAPLRVGDPRPSTLEGLVVVEEVGGYWSTHCDFGRRLPGHDAALLGRDRARDAVVNVVLPLALAMAAATNDRDLADAAWSVYRGFPRPSPYDATRRLASELGLGGGKLATARREQGLLHLVRNHCELVACSTCPLRS